ncbi:MAG: efflux RND transporter periplasmic adaptor subunit [Proteobacteria bacterium]|nr:efflux RND transporter periplasmic adaptor subunit [Pseudomonadota bacterium]
MMETTGLDSAPVARSRRLRHLAVALAVGVAAASLLAFRSEKVDVVLARQGELRQSVVASGRVRTPQRIEVAAQITGRVLDVAVREGDAIRAGQPLIRIDEREWAAAAAQARAAVVQAEARLRQLRELGLPVAEQALRQAEANALQARRQHQRVGELVARGFYSQAQLDDARRAQEVADSQVRSARLQLDSQQANGSEVELARSALEQARAALAVAEARLAYATLRAPVAGTVLTRSVEPGDTVQPGRALLTLAPAGDTELTVQIDEKNLALLRLGQRAMASADAYPHERFAAQVDYIAPSVDALRGSVEVRLRVPEPPAYLAHEMTVSIDIEAARSAQAVIVPADAVRDAGAAQPWVLAVREGRTWRQPVRIGLRGPGQVEVLEGVAPGDAVLPAAVDLPEGRSVRARVQP